VSDVFELLSNWRTALGRTRQWRSSRRFVVLTEVRSWAHYPGLPKTYGAV